MLLRESPAVFKGLMVRSPLMRSAIGWTLATPLSMARRATMLDEIFGPEAVPVDFPGHMSPLTVPERVAGFVPDVAERAR